MTQPPQQQENDEDTPVKANRAADAELVDEVPQLSMLAELDDETGEGLLDDGSSDKTEEL